MLAQVVQLLCLMQTTDAQPPASVRRDLSVAVWFAPQIRETSHGRGTLLPVAVEGGAQLFRAFVSFSYSHLPVQNIEATQWTVGARWYLSDRALAAFLGVEAGHLVQEVDDTGGRQEFYTFGAAGIGVEVVLPYGFSLSSDLKIGPEHRSKESYSEEAWLCSLRYRLGLGYRL